MGLIEKIFGSYSEKEIKRIMPLVEKIESMDEEMQKLSDNELRNKTEEFKEKGINIEDIERLILLKELDRRWITHIDEMDELRQGIGLRAYGNQNPINIYQREGFDMFEEMIESMRIGVANIMPVPTKSSNFSPSMLISVLKLLS